MAFNALYITVRQPGQAEDAAVGEVFNRFVGPAQAAAYLQSIERRHITALFRLPPWQHEIPTGSSAVSPKDNATDCRVPESRQ